MHGDKKRALLDALAFALSFNEPHPSNTSMFDFLRGRLCDIGCDLQKGELLKLKGRKREEIFNILSHGGVGGSAATAETVVRTDTGGAVQQQTSQPPTRLPLASCNPVQGGAIADTPALQTDHCATELASPPVSPAVSAPAAVARHEAEAAPDPCPSGGQPSGGDGSGGGGGSSGDGDSSARLFSALGAPEDSPSIIIRERIGDIEQDLSHALTDDWIRRALIDAVNCLLTAARAFSDAKRARFLGRCFEGSPGEAERILFRGGDAAGPPTQLLKNEPQFVKAFLDLFSRVGEKLLERFPSLNGYKLVACARPSCAALTLVRHA